MIARRFGSTVHRDRQAVNGNCVGHGVDPPMSTQALGQLNSILEGSNLTPILLSRLGNRANLLEKCGLILRFQTGTSVADAQFNVTRMIPGRYHLH